MRTARLLLGLAPIVLLASACAYGRPTAPYRPPLPPVEREDAGVFLYSRDCGWCHGDSGEGTRNGPALHGEQNGAALADFVLRTGRMPLSSAEEPMRRRPSIYTEAEIDALVDHVQRFAPEGPDVPDTHPDRGDLGLGAELYQQNCAACHSTTGVGGALTQGQFPGPVQRRTGVVAPGIEASTPVEIAEAVRTGPGAMPVFAEGVLDPDELDSLVRYVLYLQEPVDRGGAAIGRIGPVAEGAVAWMVGLGILVVFSLWIGSRMRS